MTKTTSPRYRELADQLKAEILQGRMKPGEQLMTELELCKAHDISRHTAREALRLLSDDGLITRRRGSGTVVAEPSAPVFSQEIGDFESILSYAHTSRFKLVDERAALRSELKPAGLKGSFRRIEGVRLEGEKPPIALTRIYCLSTLSPDREALSSLKTSISEWIEQTHGVSVNSVGQRMEAVALTPKDAKLLGVTAGSPALSTVRTYRDASGRTILYSLSLHPAGRFAYEMQLDRSKA